MPPLRLLSLQEKPTSDAVREREEGRKWGGREGEREKEMEEKEEIEKEEEENERVRVRARERQGKKDLENRVFF